MKRERRQFDKEFKLMAVNLCHSGKSTKDVSEELNIRPDIVRRWKRELEQHGEGSFSGHGNMNLTAEQKEAAGVGQDLIRLSVGLEDIEDLKTDLENAFATIDKSVLA